MAKTDKEQTTTVLKSAGNAVSKTLSVEGAAVQIGEDGKTTIYPQVVAKIAGIAVREVEGVYRLVPFGAGQQVASLAKTVTRSEMRDLGVRVEVGTREAAVDVRIITFYGASIPAVSDAIRRNISDRIEAMTGLAVVEVNIEVVDLYFADEEEEEAQPLTRRVE